MGMSRHSIVPDPGDKFFVGARAGSHEGNPVIFTLTVEAGAQSCTMHVPADELLHVSEMLTKAGRDMAAMAEEVAGD